MVSIKRIREYSDCSSVAGSLYPDLLFYGIDPNLKRGDLLARIDLLNKLFEFAEVPDVIL